MPLDQHQRRIVYLRLSLTDRCNLRCRYCMPEDVARFALTEDLLRPEEYERVVRAAVRAGFRKFRLTGGEPTMRADLLEIVERLARIDGTGPLAMTTNGLRLSELAEDLARAGLRRVNIHVDSLRPVHYARLMRRGVLEQALAGIAAAERAGLTPIKLNVVVARGHNDADVVDLAQRTLDRPWHMRFIELMPFGNGECGAFSREHFVSNSQLRRRIEEALGRMVRLENADPADEAVNYRLPDARGVVGFISPVSAPYCAACNRLRLTATGRLHLCLLNDDEVDLRPALRSGADEAQLAQLLCRAVQRKPVGHSLTSPGATGAEATPASTRLVTLGVSTRVQMYQLGG